MVDLTSKFGRVAERYLNNDYVIWPTTVDSNLAPQPRPVWFIWEEDTFLIFSQAKAHKVRHIVNNPKVALNFNKYESSITDLNMPPEEFSREYSTAIRIKPSEVRGWE